MFQAILVTLGYLLYRLYDSRISGDPVWWEDVGIRSVAIFIVTYVLRMIT
jgi:hypothetical protein